MTACTINTSCDLPNIHCTYPDCTKGRVEKAPAKEAAAQEQNAAPQDNIVDESRSTLECARKGSAAIAPSVDHASPAVAAPAAVGTGELADELRSHLEMLRLDGKQYDKYTVPAKLLNAIYLALRSQPASDAGLAEDMARFFDQHAIDTDQAFFRDCAAEVRKFAAVRGQPASDTVAAIGEAALRDGLSRQPASGAGVEARLSLPENMDDELQWILGRPAFALRNIWVTLRASGQVIPTHMEEEQACSIFWLLQRYALHGPEKWRERAEAELQALRTRAAQEGK